MAKVGVKSRIPAPKRWWIRIFDRTIVYDVLIAWFALFGGVATAIRAFGTGQRADFWAGVLYIIGTLGVLGITIQKFLVQWNKHEEDESVHDLEGILILLHEQLMHSLSNEQRSQQVRIRLTIHIPDKQHLVQALDYIGDDAVANTAGRRVGIGAGIIGLAIREKRCIAASRENEDYRKYLEDLEKTWGFTRQEARTRDPSAMSWVAIPIGEKDPPDGVLYGDCTLRQFFDDPQVIQLLSVGVIALARYIDLRY